MESETNHPAAGVFSRSHAAPGKLVGREVELEQIVAFLRDRRGPAALLLEGAAGIGKTTLWEEGLRRGLPPSSTVVSCRPAESEAVLPFAALGDLLEPLLTHELPLLPTPQRLALEVALLRAAPSADPTDRLAVSHAALSMLRSGAAAGLVLAIDDVQWLDAPSADVLAFALRRLDEAPVKLLLARRAGSGEPAPLDLDRGLPLTRIEIGPLAVDDLDALLTSRLGARLSRPRLLELHRTSHGNPYYAIEIVRALLNGGGSNRLTDALPIPASIGALLRRRVEALSKRAGEVALLAAASPRSSPDDLTQLTGSVEGLEEALASDVLALTGSRLQFSHPLLAAVVYDAAAPAQRRQAHARLAAAASDPIEHARHLSLAGDAPDAAVSAKLEAAADLTARRGAPSVAAELLERAARMTPSDSEGDRRRRLAAAAEFHYSAGDHARSCSILEQLVESLPPGSERAARLAELSQRVPYQLQGLELSRRALAEVGDDAALEAELHFAIAASARRASTLGEAAEHARLAITTARRAGDQIRVARALAMLGSVDVMRGDVRGIERLEQAVELEEAHGVVSLHFRPGFLLGVSLAYLGDFARARPLIEAQLARASEVGDEVARGVALSSLAELELRSGNWSDAYRLSTEGAALQRQAAPLQDQAHHVLRAARVLAHLGEIDDARHRAVTLLELAPANGDKSAEISARRDLGFIELSVGDPGAAAEMLEPAVRLLLDLGVGLFSAHPVLHDYVEALVAAGELDRAEQANALLAAIPRPWEAAMHSRGEALIAAARGDGQAAAAAIARALAAHERLEEPFELGRTLLIKGVIERRAKRRAAARRTLGETLELFDSLGAALWAEKAASELARIPGRAGAPGELSATERRVAELVREGLSNKEVAARLFVTVRTVEANLSKVYAKLGIRSRSELARRL